MITAPQKTTRRYAQFRQTATQLHTFPFSGKTVYHTYLILSVGVGLLC